MSASAFTADDPLYADFLSFITISEPSGVCTVFSKSPRSLTGTCQLVEAKTSNDFLIYFLTYRIASFVHYHYHRRRFRLRLELW